LSDLLAEGNDFLVQWQRHVTKTRDDGNPFEKLSRFPD